MKRTAIIYLILQIILCLSCLAYAEMSDCLLALPADKILRISHKEVEFEHHGMLSIREDVEVFQHWQNDINEVPLAAVKVGFEAVVATMCQGEIIRFDVYDPLYIRTMRVAISTDQFGSIEHTNLSFAATSKLYVEEKGTGRAFQVNCGEEIEVTVENDRLYVTDVQGKVWEFGKRIHIYPDSGGFIQIRSFQRGVGNVFYPSYRGIFELISLEQDRFLVINEVDLEDYLYQVVPSEMPISWPLEALKAQAVAARTYAVAQAIYSRQGHLGFHVADSTNSQVYNNQLEAESTTKAIDETKGQILAQKDGTISSTYFYSTSPGMALTNLATWKDTTGLSLEGNSPWYRWQCSFTKRELENIFDLGEILQLQVESRDEQGRVMSLLVSGREGKTSIEGELNIRRALQPTSLERIRDKLGAQSLLPSALFFIEKKTNSEGQLESVTFYGGGSGHNLGMSQWGAKGMAEAGCDYLDILGKYYKDTNLITHSEQLRY